VSLKNVTDQELKEELARREQERCEQERRDRQERMRNLVQHRDALLPLIPHGRTSCSDDNIRNGLGSADYGARCSRCALLELTEFDAENYDFDLTLTFSPVRDPE